MNQEKWRLTQPDSAYVLADQERMREARHYFEWQARLVRPELGKRVLEVGCGLGNFSVHLKDRELLVGIEPEVSCLTRWQARFAGHTNCIGLQGEVGSPDFAKLRRYRVDSILCLNVLEHVADDALALRQMREVLPTTGRIVLLVPAFAALYGEIDRLLGHHRRYSRSGLRALARTAGFRVGRMRYINAIGFIGWWTNAKVFRMREQSLAQIRFFDRWVVPVESLLESWIAPPFGQSILATFEKSVV